MQSRRKYEHLNKKLEIIEGFKNNKNLKIFGNNNDDVLTQMAAFRVTKDGIWSDQIFKEISLD